MTTGTIGTNLLRRSLRASWLVALALAALLLPARPADAGSIVAGQLICALNFFFLAKLVKLFTEGRGASALARG